MKGTTNASAFNPEAFVKAEYADDKLTLTKEGGDKTVITIQGGTKAKLRVTYAGISDLSGIECTITPTGSIGTELKMTTESDGELVFSVEAGATYKITSVKDGVGFDSEPTVSCDDLVTTAPTINCYVPGVVTVTVKDSKNSVYGRKVTATCDGQTTQTQTVSDSGNEGTVSFSLPAGTWTLSVDYPDAASGGDSVTQTVEVNQEYAVTLNVIYNLVYGYQIYDSVSEPATTGSTGRVVIPATIFGQTNNAATVTTATGVGSPGGWSSVPLITEMNFNDIFNGDAMVYIPTWYKRKEKSNGVTTIAYSREKIDDNWLDLAGSVDDTRYGHFRVGKYLTSSGHISKVNTTPLVDTSITTFIQSAQARKYNSNKYDIMTWYQWDYITDLLPMIYKTTNLQSIMRGYVDSHNAVTTSAALTEDAIGMAGSSSDGRIAVFGIHDLWGNAYQFVGGARTDASRALWCRKDLSAVTDLTTENGWFQATDALFSSNSSGWVSKVAGTTLAGNIPTEFSGSSSTYFADSGGVNASYFPRVGGYCNSGDDAGPFGAFFDNSATNAYSDVGARLSYRY